MEYKGTKKVLHDEVKTNIVSFPITLSTCFPMSIVVCLYPKKNLMNL